MRIARALLAGLFTGGAAACAGDLTEPAPTVAPVEIGSAEIAGGDGQEGISYDFLRDSLRVRVTDKAGNPVSGVVVKWSAKTGRVSPAESLTGVAGIATTAWSFFASPLGTHTATATANGTHSVTFTGYVRVGLALHSLSIVPDRVNVTSSAAQVVLTARVTDDHTRGVDNVAALFYNPTAAGSTFTTWLVPFQLISGTVWDGVWRGILTVPQGAEVGAWKLGRMLISTPGCASTTLRTYFDTELRSRGMPYEVTVTTAPLQPDLIPSLRIEETRTTASAGVSATSESPRLSCS